jgi:hypothetical protein
MSIVKDKPQSFSQLARSIYPERAAEQDQREKPKRQPDYWERQANAYGFVRKQKEKVK